MEIYFQLINDAEGLKKAVAELENEPFLGFDVETTELEPYRGELARATVERAKYEGN